MPFSYNIIELRLCNCVCKYYKKSFSLVLYLFQHHTCSHPVASWLNWIKFFRGWSYLHLYWCGTGPTDLNQKYSVSSKQCVSYNRDYYLHDMAKFKIILFLKYLASVLLKSHYITEADDLPDLVLWLEPSGKSTHSLYKLLYL